MDPADRSSQSPAHNFFDTANLLGPPPFAGASSLPYAHLAHIPSAFSMLGRHPAFPMVPFGGLGALGDGLGSPLRSPNSLAHSLSPTTGGADWWRAASEHARRAAGGGVSLDFLTGPLNSGFVPTFGNLGLGIEGSPPGLDSLFMVPADGDKSQLFPSPFSSAVFSLSSNIKATSSSPSSSKSSSTKATAASAMPITITSSKSTSNDGMRSLLTNSKVHKQRHKASKLPLNIPTPIGSKPANETTSADRKHKEKARNNSEETSSQSDLSSGSSSLSSNSEDASTTSSDDDKDKRKNSMKSPNNKHSHPPSNAPHIDGAKKRLLADQILKRVQSKPIINTLTVPTLLPGRKRSRKPMNKAPSQILSAQQQEEQSKKQDQLRKQLERELKQQQLMLRIMKKAQAQEDRISKQHHENPGAPASTHQTPSRPKSHAPKQVNKGPDRAINSSATSTNSSSTAKHGDPLVASFKSFTKEENMGTGSSEESSDNNSESSSDDSSETDTESGTDASDLEHNPVENGTEMLDAAKGDKRPAEDLPDDPGPTKRRRVIDEKEARIPLEYGWRRQTRIRSFGQRGMMGEVLYIAPCGKKLRLYPDVMKYLAKNGITDLTKDNFSFSTKLNIGEFFEAGSVSNGYTLLSEQEVMERYTILQMKRAAREAAKEDKNSAQPKRGYTFKPKYGQEVHRNFIHEKRQRRAERKLQKDVAKREKLSRVFERKKHQDSMKMLKQQEKLQRQDQVRLEREMRAQQIIEARRHRKEIIERMKFAEAVRKAKSNLLWYHMEREREMKRQQAVMMKEQERERRRQHFMLVKALEARKKNQEKEKVKEQKRAEKQVSIDRKMEMRRMEFQIAQELKKPCDDMELRDAKALPLLSKIAGVRLNGEAFADCMMIMEFLHNFGDALGFDTDSLPTLNTLQNALLNETEDDVEELVFVTTHLLKFALEDPGFPNPKEAVTKLGQKLTELDINDTILSEALRIFVVARNGGENDISQWLDDHPLESLTSSQKAKTLAYLCDELLCSKVITSEIDKNIEGMANLRRDKWIVEGKIRKMRILNATKFRQSGAKSVADGSNLATTGDDDSNAMHNISMGSKQGSDDDEESGNESDSTNTTMATGNVSDIEEEEITTIEEYDKKMDKLSKQHGQYRNKVFDASHKLRAICLGNDRFKRRYWVLPFGGGIFVEGLESGEVPADRPAPLETAKDNKPKLLVKMDLKSEDDKSDIKMEWSENDDVQAKDIKSERDIKVENPVDDEACTDDTSETVSECNATNKDPKEVLPDLNGIDSVKSADSATEAESETDLPVGFSKDSTKLNVVIPTSSVVAEHVDKGSKSIMTCPSPSPIKSLTNGVTSDSKTEFKSSSFMSIDTILKKDNSPSCYNNQFLPFMYPTPPIGTDPMLKSYPSISEQNPWFSILPRMPCDEGSITRAPNTPVSSTRLHNSPLPFISPVPFHPFQIPSPSFSSFHLGQGSMSDFSMSSFNNSENMDSFKIPEVPYDVGWNTNNNSGSGTEWINNIQGPPLPIPLEMQKGWSKISDPEELKAIVKCLHPRGIREKNLQKNIQKYFDYACASCTKGNKEALTLEVKEEEETDEGKPAPETSSGSDAPVKTESLSNAETPEDWLTEVLHEIEMALLEEVEAAEDRVLTSSLQVKGWKIQMKATENPEVHFVKRSQIEKNENEFHPLDVARERLLTLEKNIERRYLKPPLSKSIQLKLATINSMQHAENSGELPEQEVREMEPTEQQVPSGLLTWRTSVATATSAAQMTLCIHQLVGSISWEKSIMKVLCQICRRDDNEAQLLLCDGCDKGYHTYCFKPKLDTIPDGDWYCYECVTKATGMSHCIVCGKRSGKLAECNQCPRAFHIDCIDPPLSRLQRKWTCPTCISEKSTKKRKGKKRSDSTASRDRKDSDTANKSDTASKPDTTTAVEKNQQDTLNDSTDMSICRTVLTEMDAHNEGWPFLQPVNFKQFPTYKKYIKHPMDFTTMRNKLRDNMYSSRAEFSVDMRLIFDNCKMFNEDDSEVGEAGHTMRKYFEKRWTDLCANTDAGDS